MGWATPLLTVKFPEQLNHWSWDDCCWLQCHSTATKRWLRSEHKMHSFLDTFFKTHFYFAMSGWIKISWMLNYKIINSFKSKRLIFLDQLGMKNDIKRILITSILNVLSCLIKTPLLESRCVSWLCSFVHCQVSKPGMSFLYFTAKLVFCKTQEMALLVCRSTDQDGFFVVQRCYRFIILYGFWAILLILCLVKSKHFNFLYYFRPKHLQDN